MIPTIIQKLKTNESREVASALELCGAIKDIEKAKEVLSGYFCSLYGSSLSDPKTLVTATSLLKVFKNIYPTCAGYLSLAQFRFLMQASHNDKCVNYNGHTLLHAAAINTTYDELLDLTIDQSTINVVDKTDSYANTALHILIANEINDRAIKLIKLAKEKNIIIDFKVADAEGKTTLILAAKMRSFNVVNSILDSMNEEMQKQVVNLQDKDGRTALHYAMLLGDKASVVRLMQCGASLDIKDKSGLCPADYLSIAESKKTNEIKKILTSVSINFDRDEKARSNFILGIYFDAPASISGPLPSIPSKIEESAKKGQDKTYQLIKKLSNCEIFDVKKLYDSGMPEESLMSAADKSFFMKQYQAFTGKNLLTACIEGQKEVQDYLSNKNVHETKNPSVFFSNPELSPAAKLYDQGLKEYNQKILGAKDKFEMALELFKKENQFSYECGKCYSALASCYRDLKQYDIAIAACEKAIPIYEKQNRNQEDIKKLKTKYNNCKLLKEQELKIPKVN